LLLHYGDVPVSNAAPDSGSLPGNEKDTDYELWWKDLKARKSWGSVYGGNPIPEGK